ncbi:MAG: response regulator [Pseudomonadota bacterium]
MSTNQAASPQPDSDISAASLGVAPIRCLLLDDSRFDRRRVMHTANRAGLRMNVSEAATLAEARAHLAEQSFSLHIFDYRLPDGDGIGFAREVLSTPVHQSVPTIILSGQGKESTSLSAIMAGCADYLTKETLSPASFHASVIGALHKATLRTDPDAPAAHQEAIRSVLDALCEARIDDVKIPLSRVAHHADILRETGMTSSELQAAIDALAQNCQSISTQLEEIERLARGYEN